MDLMQNRGATFYKSNGRSQTFMDSLGRNQMFFKQKGYIKVHVFSFKLSYWAM